MCEPKYNMNEWNKSILNKAEAMRLQDETGNRGAYGMAGLPVTCFVFSLGSACCHQQTAATCTAIWNKPVLMSPGAGHTTNSTRQGPWRLKIHFSCYNSLRLCLSKAAIGKNKSWREMQAMWAPGVCGLKVLSSLQRGCLRQQACLKTEIFGTCPEVHCVLTF